MRYLTLAAFSTSLLFGAWSAAAEVNEPSIYCQHDDYGYVDEMTARQGCTGDWSPISQEQYQSGLAAEELLDSKKPGPSDKDESVVINWDDYYELADRGDAWVQFNLGNMYARGYGVPKNDTEALKRAVAAFERRDYYTALQELRPLAERGNAQAQLKLGFLYHRGWGFFRDRHEPDFAKAEKWYRKAAQQGLAEAQFTLGVMLTQGETGWYEAVKWFQKAAEQGDIDGQNELGIAYRDGRGVTRNYAEALKWFGKSAERGDTLSQLQISSMYGRGEGFPQNMVLSLMWGIIAEDSGNPWLVWNTESHRKYMNPFDISKAQALAAEWLEKHNN